MAKRTRNGLKVGPPENVQECQALHHAASMGLYTMIRDDRAAWKDYRDPGGHWAAAEAAAEAALRELRLAREAAAALLRGAHA